MLEMSCSSEVGGGRQVRGVSRTDRTGGREGGGRRREVAGVRRGRDEEAKKGKAREYHTKNYRGARYKKEN